MLLFVKIKSFCSLKPTGTRTNHLYEFLFRLLSSFSVGRERCIDIADVDKFLISFTFSQGMSKQSFRLRDWGFDNMCLKDKLAILRRLLEYQLDKNLKVLQSVSYAKGTDIRHEPLGRDSFGNYYWHFVDGRSSYVVKELVDPNSDTFCEIIKNQSVAHVLIEHIKRCKEVKSDRKRTKGLDKFVLVLSCGMCKKTFKGNQIKDEALRFDNTDWFCPNCEQKQLIDTVTELFLSEE